MVEGAPGLIASNVQQQPISLRFFQEDMSFLKASRRGQITTQLRNPLGKRVPIMSNAAQKLKIYVYMSTEN